MDTMSMEQLRELTETELRAKIAEFQKEHSGLRFKAGTEVLANPMDLRKARRTVARIQTVLAERARKAK